jgi:hypothetical protein
LDSIREKHGENPFFWFSHRSEGGAAQVFGSKPDLVNGEPRQGAANKGALKKRPFDGRIPL